MSLKVFFNLKVCHNPYKTNLSKGMFDLTCLSNSAVNSWLQLLLCNYKNTQFKKSGRSDSPFHFLFFSFTYVLTKWV